MGNQYKSLPGWTYTSEAFFELEKTELILKNWQLVCHLSNVPKSGDFFTFEIFNERIFIIRDEDKIFNKKNKLTKGPINFLNNFDICLLLLKIFYIF